jgi:hypothetical protein
MKNVDFKSRLTREKAPKNVQKWTFSELFILSALNGIEFPRLERPGLFAHLVVPPQRRGEISTRRRKGFSGFWMRSAGIRPSPAPYFLFVDSRQIGVVFA